MYTFSAVFWGILKRSYVRKKSSSCLPREARRCGLRIFQADTPPPTPYPPSSLLTHLRLWGPPRTAAIIAYTLGYYCTTYLPVFIHKAPRQLDHCGDTRMGCRQSFRQCCDRPKNTNVRISLPAVCFVWQIVVIILFGIFIRYDQESDAHWAEYRKFQNISSDIENDFYFRYPSKWPKMMCSVAFTFP